MSRLDEIKNSADIKNLDLTQLKELAAEIRQLILDTVLKNGGHLASSLGAVEIILAMHFVFDPPQDKLLFDVGHQSYAHKILTGRKEQFAQLRLFGGISGFPKITESEYDAANTGHSSTAISIGTGYAKAMELKKDRHTVVSLVGDGAMTGGLCYEALNYSNNAKTRQIVILNDNAMSIGKNVGYVANYLLKLHGNNFYRKFKSSTSRLYGELKITGNRQPFFAKLKNSIKYFVQSGLPFDQYGYRYFGPIDGHDLKALVEALELAKKEDDNSIIHVVTKKGKGFLEAEEKPGEYHGYTAPCKCAGASFSAVFGEALCALANADERVIALTAAMADGTGLSEFQKQYPNRLIDVGIAEAQAACMSVGLALGGMKPYFAVYASFLQRACDQIIHDIALHAQPVTLCIDRAGIVPSDGETHQGIYDLSFLRNIPNISVCAPADAAELREMLDFSVSFDAPLAIRYPKGHFCDLDQICETQRAPFVFGKWTPLSKSAEITLLATGALMVRESLLAAQILKEKYHLDVCVVNASSVKPLDTDYLDRLSGRVFTLEDHLIGGGFGSAVAEYYCGNKNKAVDLTIFAIENTALTHGSVEELLKMCRLDAESIAKRVADAT